MGKTESAGKNSQKVRLGIIGAGFSATTLHIPQFRARPEVIIVAVCWPGAKMLRIIQDKFEIPQGFEDYREMLDKVPMDAVLVSTPPGLHREHAVAALERGLHVMCEKPMCTTGADAHTLVKAAETAASSLPSSKPPVSSVGCACSCFRPVLPNSTARSNAPTARIPRSSTRSRPARWRSKNSAASCAAGQTDRESRTLHSAPASAACAGR